MAIRLFRDRADAGRFLATKLAGHVPNEALLVLGVPRGGIPVAYEVARSLRAPLDVFVARKLGLPGHEEFAMGAVASGGVIAYDPLWEGVIGREHLNAVVERESAELERREHAYRDHRPPNDPRGKTVILVDDGLATGASMQVAVRALRRLHPKRIIVAVPVASSEACASLAGIADEVMCAQIPDDFYAVGQWYQDFAQVSDDEVCALLQRALEERGQPPKTSPGDAA